MIQWAQYQARDLAALCDCSEEQLIMAADKVGIERFGTSIRLGGTCKGRALYDAVKMQKEFAQIQHRNHLLH
jgi:hypothetical protein